MSRQDKERYILQELKRHGCRITSQRRLLIDIILRDECCSCKEIYYQAAKSDPDLGMATVYRMVRTLEETGLIRRKNMYQIQCGERSACYRSLDKPVNCNPARQLKSLIAMDGQVGRPHVRALDQSAE